LWVRDVYALFCNVPLCPTINSTVPHYGAQWTAFSTAHFFTHQFKNSRITHQSSIKLHSQMIIEPIESLSLLVKHAIFSVQMKNCQNGPLCPTLPYHLSTISISKGAFCRPHPLAPTFSYLVRPGPHNSNTMAIAGPWQVVVRVDRRERANGV
jgi:hypothetical protein